MPSRETASVEAVADSLREKGVHVVLERFRVPAWPQASPAAGLALCAAGAFLLAAGRPAAAFLVGVSGSLLLLLDAYGFSPLGWLGPKVSRSVAVVPGDPSEPLRKALFLAVPLACRITASGRLSRKESLRHAAFLLGVLISLALVVLAGGVTLLYLSPLPAAGVALGAALSALAAEGWVRRDLPPGPPNLAAGWVDRWVRPAEGAPRPFVLLYSGDEAEVSFFLAKYRGAVLRGSGIFLEFPEGAGGAPALSVREGPLLPYRVDAALVAAVGAAGQACGIPCARRLALRFRSAGLVAMARGFRAITLFRAEVQAGAGSLSDESAAAWIATIVGAQRRDPDRRKPGDETRSGAALSP